MFLPVLQELRSEYAQVVSARSGKTSALVSDSIHISLGVDTLLSHV